MATLMKEINAANCTICPHCGKAYPPKDERGKGLRAPEACERCGSPLELKAFQKFSDQMAEKEHDPSFAAIGAIMRGEKRSSITPDG